MAVTPVLLPVAAVSLSPPADLLLVDASPEAAAYTAFLRGSYRVATTSSIDVARQYLHRHVPSMVVTDLDLQGADGVDICPEAKALAAPPSVLVMTTQAGRVPHALVAGCDGVLLKPFAPNLLFGRLGRLLRTRPRGRKAGVRG